MAKKNTTTHRTSEQLRTYSDYYRLNTKAVNDLVDADETNSPEVPAEELARYRSRSGIPLAKWLKVILLKAWFAGSVCFFILWGLGVYLPSTLDQLLVTGLAMGVVTDLLVNGILRFTAETPTANDRWMMFPKKHFACFFFNILYAFALLFCVFCVYQTVNASINAFTGQADAVPLGVEPILFGLFYMGFDMLFLGCKNLFARILADARASVSGSS